MPIARELFKRITRAPGHDAKLEQSEQTLSELEQSRAAFIVRAFDNDEQRDLVAESLAKDGESQLLMRQYRRVQKGVPWDVIQGMVSHGEAHVLWQQFPRLSLSTHHEQQASVALAFAQNGLRTEVLERLFPEGSATKFSRSDIEFLSRMILEGGAGEALVLLEQHHFTMTNYQEAYLLASLIRVDPNSADWVFSRVQDSISKGLDLSKPESWSNFISVAIELVAVGYAAWIKEQLYKTKLRVDASVVHLYKKMSEHGQAEWVARQCMAIYDSTTDSSQSELIELLVRGGQATWIRQHLESNSPQMSEDRRFYHLSRLVELGEGQAIADYCQQHIPLDLTNWNHAKLRAALRVQGIDTWTTHQVDQATISLGLSKDVSLVVNAIRAGYWELVATKVDLDSLIYFAPSHLYLLQSLVEVGQVDVVEQLRGRVADKTKRSLQFSPETITAIDRHLERRANNGRDVLDEELNQQFDDWMVPADDPFRILVFDAITKVPPRLFPFVRLAAREHTVVSRAFIRALDSATGATSSSFSVGLHKEGSELTVYGKVVDSRLEIGFVSDMRSECANVWQYAHDHRLPVAPIVKQPRIQGDHARVYSVYCGDRIETIVNYEALHQELRTYFEDLYAQLMIDCTLLRIDHGHPHTGNVTVEYVSKDYLAQHPGQNINEIPRDHSVVMYDLNEYVRASDKWQPVVRLIDWDRAKRF